MIMKALMLKKPDIACCVEMRERYYTKIKGIAFLEHRASGP
ncbi:MAG TPA: hypothetical protein P5062_05345 [Methanothrix sp.]|nr:hypothetical protein [Methanothrix sp.]HRU75572.1 hypothetical protein [Methanothrix sp.]